jgi:hypothetical protein
MFQSFKIVQGIDARSRTVPLWFRQTDAVVMMQRSNRHTREFSELTDFVASSHRLLSVDTDKDASGGSFAISDKSQIGKTKRLTAEIFIRSSINYSLDALGATSGVNPGGETDYCMRASMFRLPD